MLLLIVYRLSLSIFTLCAVLGVVLTVNVRFSVPGCGPDMLLESVVVALTGGGLLGHLFLMPISESRLKARLSMRSIANGYLLAWPIITGVFTAIAMVHPFAEHRVSGWGEGYSRQVVTANPLLAAGLVVSVVLLAPMLRMVLTPHFRAEYPRFWKLFMLAALLAIVCFGGLYLYIALAHTPSSCQG